MVCWIFDIIIGYFTNSSFPFSEIDAADFLCVQIGDSLVGALHGQA